MVRTERELWELGACSTVMLRARALAEAVRQSALTRPTAVGKDQSEGRADPRRKSHAPDVDHELERERQESQ
jgi:hypothetical protein